MSELDNLRQILLNGQRLSMQGSYQRRKPAEKALPYLNEAREGLAAFVHEDKTNAEGWRLLSLAEECLLHYRAAVWCLKRAMELSGRREKKDLKRLALLEECAGQWSRLRLTPTELSELGDYLVARLAEWGCDRSLRFTRQWLAEAGIQSSESALDAIVDRGGYCDCEALSYVMKG
jgi:uncharacterized protein DUF2695